MILILSNEGDGTADDVVAELDQRGAEYLRCDLADFPQRLAVSAVLDGALWRGQLLPSGGSVPLEDLQAVYYRRPSTFRLPDHLSAEHRRFAAAEARAGLGGLLAALPVRWINHPFRVADAEFKPLQLNLAARYGLHPPRTMITNVASDARRFHASIGGPMVYKPLTGRGVRDGDGSLKLIYTATAEIGADDDDSISLTANLFQAAVVPKAYDVRLTVVGVRMFAVVIHADTAAAHADWRADYGALRYEPIDPPDLVRAGVAAYLRDLGLAFGAFDFAVDHDGRWWFLECNSNGQWGWIAHATGLPIAAAVADLLTEEATP